MENETDVTVTITMPQEDWAAIFFFIESFIELVGVGLTSHWSSDNMIKLLEKFKQEIGRQTIGDVTMRSGK